MRTIKKITLGFCLFLSLQSFTQETKPMKDAFTNSFLFESKTMYLDAIKVMKDVYSDKSYLINARLGWLCYLNKEYVNSVTYYKKAAELNPKATEPLWGLVMPLIAQEKWTEVEAVYLNIVRFDPKNSLVNYRLGMIYYYRKNYTEALKYFDVTLTLYPFDYDSMIMSAWTTYFLGRKEEAKVLFTRVLIIYQSDPSGLEGEELCKK